MNTTGGMESLEQELNVNIRPFQSEFIIEEKISEATLRVYHVGYDDEKFRLEVLTELIANVIPEFAFGLHEGESLNYTELVQKLRSAVRTIYDTDKYDKRGEFGELILHLLLRDFCGSIPLISKIYFKDTPNIPVHGFDGVHVVLNGSEKKLWLGESKLYTNGMDGVKSLAEDVAKHLAADYLRTEFLFISRKIPTNFPERMHWINLIHQNKTLDSILDGVCIPLVCTYSSDTIQSHKAATEEYFAALESECRKLKAHFDENVMETDVDIILMLLPVENKPDLVSALHSKLKKMQEI